MDITVVSIVTAVATIFTLPILSYLVVRRDQKIDETARAQNETQLELIRTQGEVKALQVKADIASSAVTRREFEQGMASLQRGLDDIKRRLDRDPE